MQPSAIISGTTNLVRWRSTLGTATRDNGDLILHRARQVCSYFFCTFITTDCRVNQQLYTVEPIPGTYSWQRPPKERCLNWLPFWLPLIQR